MKSVLFCLVLMFLIVPVSATDWLDVDWNNRRNITINHSHVDAVMTNFPTMVSITQLGLNTDGNDIRITDSSGNPVAREIECYNVTSGELVFFFNGTSISDTSDTLFWMYYNNSAASEPAADSTYGSQAVWDSDHNMVQLMNTAANSNILDSTSNGINSTSADNFEAVDTIDGDYGKGIIADGVNEYYGFGDVLDLNDMSYTLEFRLKGFEWSTGLLPVIISKWYDGTNAEWNFASMDDGASGTKLQFTFRDQANNNRYLNSNNAFDTTIEHTIQINYDGTTHRLYVDGVLHDSNVATAIRQGNNAELRLFRYSHTTLNYYGAGTIYQTRISQNKYRDENWASITHNNLNNPTATGTAPFFLSFGAEESYEAPPPALNGTYLYPNSTYSTGCYGKLINELVYETGFNFSDIGSCNALTTADMEVLSTDDTNYIPSIDKDAAHDGYMYGNFSLPNVKSVNFINVKTVHNRNETNPVILGLFNVSTQKWHAVNNSSVEIIDVELTYNITGTDIIKYTTLVDNTLNLSVSLNTNGDGNYDVFVDFVEVYIDYEEAPDTTLEYVYNLTISNQNNISILQTDVDDLKNNVNNLYMFVLLCTVFLVAALRKRGENNNE